MSSADFFSLKLSRDLLSNLDSLGYKEMTSIQSLSLPLILANKDLIGQGKTGSGKTAAFGLGIINKLDIKSFKPQSIVICPTRELAEQVAEEVRRLARKVSNVKVITLCGGSPLVPQIASLRHRTHVIVGTPGRIEEHLRKDTLDLNGINMLVLDEADRMLDMGFQESIEKIVSKLPLKRQTLLFSATFPEEINIIASNIMNNPIKVKSESVHKEKTIKQFFYKTNSFEDRMIALRILLSKRKLESVLVFCNTKKETKEVANELNNFGHYALAIHGDLDQRDRDQSLIRFTNKSASVLVATDVAARGLDIDSLDMVVNYKIAHNPEIHIHRIGRTGRAGRVGIACTLCSDKEVRKIEEWDFDEYSEIFFDDLPSHDYLSKPPKKPAMITIKIDGGKKQKLRPGDIVGGVTGDGLIGGDKIGKIHVANNWSYVAVRTDIAKDVLRKIKSDRLKGKNFRARILS